MDGLYKLIVIQYTKWKGPVFYRTIITITLLLRASSSVRTKMSQPTQSCPLTVLPLHQWNPIEILNINLKPDGSINCSGIRKDSKPCGWGLDKDVVANISNFLDSIAGQPPQSATPILKSLADITLCHNHKTQAWSKATEWGEAVKHLSSPRAGLDIVELHGSLPPYRPTLTPQSIPSLPIDGDASLGSLRSRIQSQRGQNSSSTLQTSHSTIEEQVCMLQEEVKHLSTRIVVLEVNGKEIEATVCVRKTSSWSWARLGSRLRAFLKRKN